LPAQIGATVLDVGCGTGLCLPLLHDKVGRRRHRRVPAAARGCLTPGSPGTVSAMSGTSGVCPTAMYPAPDMICWTRRSGTSSASPRHGVSNPVK
jgi:hypothetical protein